MLLSIQLKADRNLVLHQKELKEMKAIISESIENALENQASKVPEKVREAQEHIAVAIKFLKSTIGLREAFHEDASNLKNILDEYTAFLEELKADNYDINILQEHIGNLNYYIGQVPEEAYRKYYACDMGGSLYFLKADNKLVNMAYLMKNKKDEIKDIPETEPLLHYIANKQPYSRKYLRHFTLEE